MTNTTSVRECVHFSFQNTPENFFAGKTRNAFEKAGIKSEKIYKA